MKRLALFLFSFFILTQCFAGAQEDLFTAALACDLAGVQKAIDGGADANAINPANGQNALASSFFCADVTKLLLDNGCDPNGGSYPAIIQAGNNYCVDVMKLLLDAGADPNAVGKIDPGAGMRKMIADEKAKGKKANKTTIKIWEAALENLKPTNVTALRQTVQQTNCVPCLEMLLKAGADPAKEELDGGILHVLAAFSMTQEERKANFKLGAPNMKAYGLTPPDWYADLPDDKNGTPTQMLNLLAGAGVDVNAKRSDGVSALMVALRLHKLELSKAMVKNGADAVSETVAQLGSRKIKSYPINAAAEFADLQLMQMILDQKPDVNTTVETAALGVTMNSDYKGNTNWGGDGYTPLIISIMSGKTDVANLLLDNGASIKIGSSGISIIPTKFVIINCLTQIKNKTPIYWEVEQEDLALVEKIAEKMEWKFNPDFTIKQYGGSGNTMLGLKCAKFKKKQSPSLYAMTVGNSEAYKLLSAKGL